ncbi:MAG: hypothetical protein ABL907_12480 [Hyphomicrobium sp.]
MSNEPKTTLQVGTSYVEWGPIFAGAVAAAALSFVLLTSGAAIGLSLVSPYPSQSYGRWTATLATWWALSVTIGSFLVGGYIAGRLRTVWGDANADEVQFRDGIHGMLMWSVSILMGGLFAYFVGTTTTLVGAEVGKPVGYSSERGSVLAPAVDVLLRGSQGTSAGTGLPASPALKDEITRVLVTSVSAGKLTDNDRSYLAKVVAQHAGVASAEADKRVGDVYAESVRMIDEARKAAVLVGLVTTTALLFGLAATWYAAQRGGHHRDHNMPAKFSFYIRLKS